MTEGINLDLFPTPIHPPRSSSLNNPLIPRTWPGVSPSSTATLQSILSDNHKRWHVFFNENQFHNHSAHSVLTLWCLGADKSLLESAYKQSSAYQRAAFPSPSSISQQNWRDYVGDERYYQAYLEFFTAEVNVKSFDTILEEYIFAPKANFVEGPGKQPQMLTRFFAGLIHPLIHTGLGIEFGLPGTFAEGLAQTAVHRVVSQTTIITPSWFLQDENELASRFAQGVDMENAKTGTHAFTILGRILADPRLDLEKPRDEGMIYTNVLDKAADVLREYVDQWNPTGDLQKKLEELLWTNVLIYGVCGSEGNGNFNADFFHMHFVTSSLFLSSIFSLLKRSSQELLLRGYFAICLIWYIARGRPEVDIARFFGNAATLHPIPPGPKPTPHKDVSPSPTSSYAIIPNPWLPIIQSTLTHPDDHLPKLQRALAEYSSRFGSTPAGYFKGTELKDAELIDGTLFVRVAGLTAGRLGWVREGEPPLGSWDRRGFFKVADQI
ncbi:hypothetical protein BYT27DRAFT_7107925 [Phlegmacium glaucopus]|nr:hypothetical protein BYT27DRAFT_7107925 [Phlegmacium glaucopus]